MNKYIEDMGDIYDDILEENWKKWVAGGLAACALGMPSCKSDSDKGKYDNWDGIEQSSDYQKPQAGSIVSKASKLFNNDNALIGMVSKYLQSKGHKNIDVKTDGFNLKIKTNKGSTTMSIPELKQTVITTPTLGNRGGLAGYIANNL